MAQTDADGHTQQESLLNVSFFIVNKHVYEEKKNTKAHTTQIFAFFPVCWRAHNLTTHRWWLLPSLFVWRFVALA